MKHIIYSLAIAMVIFSVQPTNCFAEHLPPVLPILPGSNHEHENLSGLDLSDQELTDINFNHIKVNGVTIFNRSRLDGSTFIGVDFSVGNMDSVLDNTIVNGTVFDDSIFAGIDFGDIVGVGASFRNVDFTGVDFDDSRINNSDFTGAIFRDAHLGELNAQESDFTNVDFSGAKIGGAEFQGAILVNANFNDAELSPNDFNHFLNADLRGADLSQLNIFGQQDFGQTFAGSFYDNNTIFPPTFDPIAGGMIFVPEPESQAIIIAIFLTFFSLFASRRINFRNCNLKHSQ